MHSQWKICSSNFFLPSFGRFPLVIEWYPVQHHSFINLLFISFISALHNIVALTSSWNRFKSQCYHFNQARTQFLIIQDAVTSDTAQNWSLSVVFIIIYHCFINWGCGLYSTKKGTLRVLFIFIYVQFNHVYTRNTSVIFHSHLSRYCR